MNYTDKTTIGPDSIPPQANPVYYENPPDSLNITFTGISNIGESANTFRAVIVNGSDSYGTRWQAWINLTPRTTYYKHYTYSQDPLTKDISLDPVHEGYKYNRTP